MQFGNLGKLHKKLPCRLVYLYRERYIYLELFILHDIKKCNLCPIFREIANKAKILRPLLPRSTIMMMVFLCSRFLWAINKLFSQNSFTLEKHNLWMASLNSGVQSRYTIKGTLGPTFWETQSFFPCQCLIKGQ